MSGRIKIKSKAVKSALENKDILDMFEGIINGNTISSKSSLPIIISKYKTLQTHTQSFIKTLEILLKSPVLSEFELIKTELRAYCDSLQFQYTKEFSAPDMDKYIPSQSELEKAAGVPVSIDIDAVDKDDLEAFTKIFNNCKGCSLVNTIIVTCKNLTPYKQYLVDINNLKDIFLRGAGTIIAPVPFLPQLNVMRIYNNLSNSDFDKKFILTILHKLYKIGHDMYETVSMPDFDIKEFSELIIASISDIKKHIPRCDLAFKKIAASVDLLQNNFGEYYKDYTASGNPSIIMENFILDVTKTGESTPALTSQFKKIINYYKKMVSSQPHNPKLQSLFKHVDENFKELEKNFLPDQEEK